MSHKQVYTEWNGIQEAKLYLDRNGDLYQLPDTRAELVRHLHLQGRLVSHLADVIPYVTRGRGPQR